MGEVFLRTILITGGASGLGKGVAQHLLAKGDRVIAVGNSTINGQAFCNEAERLGASNRAVFIQADLSLISEGRRIVEGISNSFPVIDALVLCASKHCKERSVTGEGFEFSFALDYLSRFILSYGLKENLEKSASPVIMNICGTGMKGAVNWDDLQHTKSFNPMKVMMHGSRLNELSGVAFTNDDTVGKIKYILYNPMAVRTPGMMEFCDAAMKLYYKLAAKPIEKAVSPIVALLDDPPDSILLAYKEQKEVSLSLPSFNKENALKLYDITTQVIKETE